MAAELTSADYAFLIILKAEGRELSNTEMKKTYQVTMVKGDYEKLNADGYVESATKGRPYRHVITEAGVKVLTDPLAIDEDQAEDGAKRTLRERQLWAALVAQQNENVRLRAGRNEATPVREKPADVDGRIRSAYAKLAGAPGDHVDLTALRSQLADVSKAELDKALVRLHDEPDVRLEPEPFGHRIGAEQRSAAVHIGGEDRHKLAIGLR
jgi:hypothetical protein